MTAGFVETASGSEIVVDPVSDKDYKIAWSDYLNGDTIGTSTWAVSPTGPSLYSGSVNSGSVVIDGVTHGANTVATIWIKTLTAGVRYLITNRIVTAAVRTDERSFWLVVRDL